LNQLDQLVCFKNFRQIKQSLFAEPFELWAELNYFPCQPINQGVVEIPIINLSNVITNLWRKKVHDEVSSRPADRPDPHPVWTAPAETDARGGSRDDPDHIPRFPLSRRRQYRRRRFCRRRRHLPPLKVDSSEIWGGSERWLWLGFSLGTVAIDSYLPFEHVVIV
jgi:hypothetical protein